MAETTVFTVAAAILAASKKPSISPLKLQKLVFYCFGAYAHQTGEALFSSEFYAMERGPVVGELLSFHYGKTSIDALDVEKYRAEVLGEEGFPPKQVQHLADAVWAELGKYSPHQLVEMTHSESIWITRWDSRWAGSKRADIPARELVDYFISKSALPQKIGKHLPERKITPVSSEVFEILHQPQSSVSEAFVRARKKSEFRLVSSARR